MFSAAWKMLKDTILAFINDEALSRGAAIAFYTVTSVGLAALATAVCKTLLAHEAAQLRLEQVTLQAGGLAHQRGSRGQGSSQVRACCHQGGWLSARSPTLEWLYSRRQLFANRAIAALRETYASGVAAQARIEAIPCACHEHAAAA